MVQGHQQNQPRRTENLSQLLGGVILGPEARREESSWEERGRGVINWEGVVGGVRFGQQLGDVKKRSTVVGRKKVERM